MMPIAAKVMKPFGELNRSPRSEVWGLFGSAGSQEASNDVRREEFLARLDEKEGGTGRGSGGSWQGGFAFQGVEALQTHR